MRVSCVGTKAEQVMNRKSHKVHEDFQEQLGKFGQVVSIELRTNENGEPPVFPMTEWKKL